MRILFTGILVGLMLASADACGVDARNAPSPSGPETAPEWITLDTFIPGILLDIRYFGSNNFIGHQIDGYHQPKAIISKPAAEALALLYRELQSMGLTLKVFDAYRPQMAVDHFVRWAKDIDDTLMKAAFYPNVLKEELFKLQYIAERSGHTRGSTIDLTLVNLSDGTELDMGSPFDLFDPLSHHDSALVTEQQTSNRNLLRSLMLKYGFKHYPEEWWHYTLIEEPYPNTYFTFPVQ